MRQIRTVVITALLMFCFGVPVSAQLTSDISSPHIVINLPSRTLELYSENSLVKVYPIAIGKPSTPSPMGNFSIIEKEVNPWWYPPRTGEVVPSGPNNPLGYRWMGFLPMYGIHGTNAPWAIGMAVSNGCIRMHEEDVEELFEVVTYGTPVQVTYDRVKVRIDGEGRASLGVYPDIYGYSGLSLTEIKNRLADYGLGGMLSDDELYAIINEGSDEQHVFARLHGLRVNGKLLPERAVTLKDVAYVPIWPVAGALGLSINWDEQAQMVRGARRSVEGTVIGDRIFITTDNARLLFGGQQVWNEEGNSLDIDVLTVFLNGKPLQADVQVVNNILALPLLVVANAVGQKAAQAADGSWLVQGKPVPVGMVGDEPYIQITKILGVFNAYAYWNQQARTVELTYPYNVKGGND